MIIRIPFATLSLVLAAVLAACASKGEPRSAQDAMAASKARQQQSAVVYSGCYDEFGRPARPDVADPTMSGDPGCPAYPVVVQDRRSRPPAPTGSVVPSVSLPTLPVPVSGGGLGVLRR